MFDSIADFEAALAADQEEAKEPALIIPGAPYDVAKIFLERHMYEGLPTIRHYQDQFLEWRGNAYHAMDENDVRAILYEFLDNCIKPAKKSDDPPEPVKPTPALVSSVLDGLRAAANIDISVTTPAWLAGDNWRPPAREILACTNGLLHVPEKKLLDGTPTFFTLNALDFAYDTAIEPVMFHRFLNELWPGDQKSILTLQQIFGLLILPDTSF
jgi:putative DNA primase/helicase